MRQVNLKLRMLIILSASLVLGIIYIVIIPPWQSPDEPTHFEYAKVLAEGAPPWAPHPRPDLQEKIIVSLDRHDYWRYVREERPSPLPSTFREMPFLFSAPSQIGKNPPLYYFLASLVLRASPARSVEAELYRLRAFSLLLTLLTVWVVWVCAREIFGSSSPLCPAAAGITAFLPQFTVIGTSVSSDPMVNLLGALVIWLVIRFQRTGFSCLKIVLLLILHGIGLLVNYKFLILLPSLAGVFLIHYFFRGWGCFAGKKIALWGGIFSLAVILGYSGLVWNFPGIARLFLVRINILYLTLSSFFQGKTYFPAGFWHWFHAELFKSFWLKYGWLKFELPLTFYLILKIASLSALSGIVLFLGRWMLNRAKLPNQAREAVITLLIYAAVTLGAYYLFWGLKGADTTTQGRHLFLVMPAWAILFVFGWCRLFPARREKEVCFGLLAGFVVLNAVSLLFHIIPTFGWICG